jgi:hypothetical protein
MSRERRRSPVRVEPQPPAIIRSELELILRLFGLDEEWEVTIGERNDSSGPNGDYAAATTIEEGYHSASIAIGSGWPGDRDEQFTVLAHEAAHILLADYALSARRACDGLRDAERKILQPHINREEELLCDRIARMVVRCLRENYPKRGRAR